jgi:hypothetical protein
MNEFTSAFPLSTLSTSLLNGLTILSKAHLLTFFVFKLFALCRDPRMLVENGIHSSNPFVSMN